jgi:DNA-binding NarL/FixJ family response regulator
MDGLPNKLIAYNLGICEATVKVHVSSVLRKLNVRSRAQAIATIAKDEQIRTLPVNW